jgi:hypothetical protein
MFPWVNSKLLATLVSNPRERPRGPKVEIIQPATGGSEFANSKRSENRYTTRGDWRVLQAASEDEIWRVLILRRVTRSCSELMPAIAGYDA